MVAAAKPYEILSHLWDADFEELCRTRPATVTLRGKTFYWDQDAADRAVGFIENFCRHDVDEMAGQRFILEPWQRWIVEELFGWKREDGRRRYRKCFMIVARKNGKSHLVAAIMALLLYADGVHKAKVYAAAADKDQARMIYEPLVGFVEQDERLARVSEVFRDSVTFKPMKSAAYVLSGKANTKHGLNAHGILIDELHAHENRELLDVLMTSRGARKNSLSVIITTAGVFDENSICWKEYTYAKRVAADIEIDPYLLPIIFETSPEDDWRNEQIWHKANPALKGGNMVQIDFLQEECIKAVEDPSYENTFRQLYLNQWTQQAVKWLPMDRWKLCGRNEPPFPLEGRDCILGVDMSATTDLCAVAQVFPFGLEEVPEIAQRIDEAQVQRRKEIESPEIARWGCYVDVHCWTPNYRLTQREKQDNADYSRWAKSGYLTLVDEPAIDDAMVESHIRWLIGRYKVKRVCFDPWRAGRIAKAIEEEFGEEMVEIVPQAHRLSAANQELFAQVVSGRLIHPNNPVLTYCANNAAINVNQQGQIMIVKTKSRGRVDALTATTTAMYRAMIEPFRRKRKALAEVLAEYGGGFLK